MHTTLQPHEDGPMYFPVVATLSLGSHCVFNYYKYKDDIPSGFPSASRTTEGNGRAIDRTPIQSLLLERRSLVVSYNDKYTTYLHG